MFQTTVAPVFVLDTEHRGSSWLFSALSVVGGFPLFVDHCSFYLLSKDVDGYSFGSNTATLKLIEFFNTKLTQVGALLQGLLN